MCKLGNIKAAGLQPTPLRIATISGMSPLHEVARESEAIDKTARESVTQMTEAIKTMGKVIDKNVNENKQLKKKIENIVQNFLNASERGYNPETPSNFPYHLKVVLIG